MKILSLILSIFIWFCTQSALANDFQIISNQLIIDQGGRKIIIQKPFERIISLYAAHTENLFSLGLDKEIIGVTRHEVYPTQALTKPIFSYHDDPEKFLASRADLVLIRPMIDRGYPKLVRRLEKSGATVVSIQPGTVDDMYRYWTVLGLLTGRSAMAGRMIDGFKKEIAAIKCKSDRIENKKRVYFESIHSKMKTFSKKSMAIFALETAGGVNIAVDATPSRGTNVANYGKERILSHAHAIDVYLAQVGTMNRISVAAIKAEPGFSAIKAVKNSQVYIVDETIVSRPTLRILKGVKTIGSILYPDIFN